MNSRQISAVLIAIWVSSASLSDGILNSVIAAPAAATDPSISPLLLEPEPTVQKRLKAIEACMDREPIEFYQEIRDLVNDKRSQHTTAQMGFMKAQDPIAGLICQLALYMVDGTKISPVPSFFPRFIYLAGIKRDQLVQVLAQFADSPDPVLKSWVIEQVLGGVDLELCGRELFIPIDLYGLNNKKEFAPTLIDIMYRQNENLAVNDLESYLGVTQEDVKNISFATHAVNEVLFYDHWKELHRSTVDEAVTYLKVLLRSDKWWIRRYVAEVVWRYDIFRHSTLLIEVKHDPDSRVSAAATRPDAEWMQEEKRATSLWGSMKGVD